MRRNQQSHPTITPPTTPDTSLPPQPTFPSVEALAWPGPTDPPPTGRSTQRSGVGTTREALSSVAQARQLLQPPSPSILRTSRREPHKTLTITPSSLFDFVFPPGISHSRSTGRLTVFCLAGPTRSGSLYGGPSNKLHPLSTSEVKAMVEDAERDEICEVYVGETRLLTMSIIDRKAVVGHAKPSLANGPELITRAQLRAMIKKIVSPSGLIDFGDLQRAVLEMRSRRIENARRMYEVDDEVKGKKNKPWNAVAGLAAGSREAPRPAPPLPWDYMIA